MKIVYLKPLSDNEKLREFPKHIKLSPIPQHHKLMPINKIDGVLTRPVILFGKLLKR